MTQVFEGRCHCGAVRFDIELQGGLEEAQRCNCSYCSMTGSVTLTAKASDMTVVKGFDVLRVYTFGSHSTQHFFCARCGVHPHPQLRRDTKKIAVNVACLEGLSPFDFEVVPVIDGAAWPEDGPLPEEDGFAGSLAYDPRFGQAEG